MYKTVFCQYHFNSEKNSSSNNDNNNTSEDDNDGDDMKCHSFLFSL
jgi:hypothetical protein